MHLSLKGAASRIPYTNKVGETLKSIASPEAAYSLRALGGGDPKVVRLRRSSDDAEKDITVSEISSGSLVDWVNGKQETTLPCDVAPTVIAYSLRLLNSSYTGNLVRVRRSSDDAEKDFNDANDIAAWVGSGNDGFVTTWYDQSGNDNDGIQGTASNQPKVVDNGVLVSDGLFFNGNNSHLNFTSPLSFSNGLISLVSNIDSSKSTQSIIGGFNGYFPIMRKSGGTNTETYRNATVSSHFVNGQAVTNPATRTEMFNLIATDSTQLVTFSGATSLFDFTELGRGGGGASTLWGVKGFISELVIFNSNQTSNRFKIESNINNYYNLYTNLNDGFVTTLYDQSGDNHTTQSTASSQPKIVENGVGLDYIKTDGVDDFFNLTNTIQFNSNCSVLAVYADAGGNRFNLIGSASSANGIGYGSISTAFGYFSMIGPGSEQIHSSQATPPLAVNDKTEQNLVGVFWQPDSNSAIFSINGGSNEYVFSSSSQFKNDVPITLSVIGKDNDAIGQLSIKEILIFTTDQTSNRLAIETNINNYYKLY